MNVEEMIANSYRNFHVKGFDYLCVKRTPQHTRKVYFFDGNVSQLPEVVSPHDHQYDFATTVLSGVMSNSTYWEVPRGSRLGAEARVYNEFRWDTPLNGGDGFTFNKETALIEDRRLQYHPGQTYHMLAEDLHTIRMHSEGTVIVLDQFADRVPIGAPTRTFMLEREAPKLDGLYERFTPDQLTDRLEQYQQLLNAIQFRAAA